MNRINVAIFASGSGSNALRIMDHFDSHEEVNIALLFCNKQDAPIVAKSEEKGIPVHVCTNEQAADGDYINQTLRSYSIDYIILAGYLRMIPASLISSYPERIINIHPSLLPKYGGKGMYGMNVHRAVVENNEEETGISIHFVNEEFDKGRLIAQFACAISSTDTPEDVQLKVQELEHLYYAPTIEKTIV